jgi:hypothetical protein
MKTTSGSKDSTADNRPNATGKTAEENSVTFSLSALMAQGEQPSKPSNGPTKEADSGLIDLNALIAMEDSVGKGANSSPLTGGVTAHIGLFPFETPQMAAPPPPVVQAQEIERPRKSSRLWIGVGGVGAALAAGAAFWVGMHGGTADNPQTAQTATVEAAPPAAAAPAALDGTSAAEQSKVTSLDPGAPKAKEKEPPKAAPAAKAASGSTKPAAAKQDGSKEAAAPQAERKAAPGDPCKGDLMCAMQRATKK